VQKEYSILQYSHSETVCAYSLVLNFSLVIVVFLLF